MKNNDKGYLMKNLHTILMIGAIIGAVLLAWLLPSVAVRFHVGGEIFLRCLMMVVVPLVMTSVMGGILGLGDIRKLGKPGVTAVSYYITTTFIAVITGVLVFNFVQPGKNFSGGADVTSGQIAYHADHGPDLATDIAAQDQDLGDIFENLLLMLVTGNLLESMVKVELLPLIVFSIIFAGMLTTLGGRAKVISDLIIATNDAMLNFIMLLMKIAPIGIFCLIASNFGKAFANGTFARDMASLSSYMVVVFGGLGIHFFITLPLGYWLFTKRNPYVFIKNMFDALITAFSTASSSAALPVTMESAEHKAGISKKSLDFVLPLGATINMDGTALYEAAAALFIANIYAASGLDPEFTLTVGKQVIIAVTAALAAIGAAGIPEAGLVTMAIVLNAVGLPVEYMAVILPVDWFLDRFRTMTNVFGDSVGAAIVDTQFNEK